MDFSGYSIRARIWRGQNNENVKSSEVTTGSINQYEEISGAIKDSGVP